ncbi:hypothetical protein PP740_gp015 [Stenotrophomonas phage Philippe]|uniref:Uncharacterized protein n=1 Tax=Stenotrophomonas phage Philippe TaxID=2859655 RepID=A0AAE8BI29_9CAUD|nr:hypothetical protein PP740_gp015 [Stenotrophomonas phage Philippe]QYW02214.1 hypothetical protein CPT_Philippe_015 [Stenotrophomonas phage Philippe]
MLDKEYLTAADARTIREGLQNMLNSARQYLWGQEPTVPLNVRDGICCNIYRMTNPNTSTPRCTYRVLGELFSMWPKSAGNNAFPIQPYIWMKWFGYSAYGYFEGNLWLGRKGRLRRELLQFMINELEGFIQRNSK